MDKRYFGESNIYQPLKSAWDSCTLVLPLTSKIWDIYIIPFGCAQGEPLYKEVLAC